MSVIESTKQFAPAGGWSADPVHSNVSFEIVIGRQRLPRPLHGLLGVAAGRRAADPRRGGRGRLGRHQGRAAQRPSPDPGLLRRAAVPRDRLQGDGAPPFEDNRVQGKGEPTLKGTTLPIELEGVISDPATDPFGRERIGLKLETSIDRTQYGISWSAPNQSGGDYPANNVKLLAELAFVKARPEHVRRLDGARPVAEASASPTSERNL